MDLKQAIVIRAELKMSKGKVAAQAAHASVEAVLRLLKKDKKLVQKWRDEGMKKVVLKVNSLNELFELKRQGEELGLECAIIKDAGRTELPAGTITALGIGPGKEDEVDSLTGKLKML